MPDSVANQIAAGEVVQRPASVVKELLENAIDAGADKITLLVKDAGKTLIQVMDNGIGMSEEDAILSVKRHATSKIFGIEDIFNLHTMGFRGEALASISAVSQFELKTRRDEDEVSFVLRLDGKKVEKAHENQERPGTSISVKNLFFNIPARRNFLKSDNVENRHISEAFQQTALANPEISFVYHNNDREVYNLPSANFKQRIIQLFGKKFDQRLVPLKEETEIVNISGFIGKPEYATLKRSEQFFMVNGRFIKSPYLHHAVMLAYDDLLNKDSIPQYFIRLTVAPDQIDVNVHPTKTEVKFVEERSIYAILRTIVRQSLGKFNIAPSLDFERESVFDSPFDRTRTVKIPGISVDPSYNPFEGGSGSSRALREQFERVEEMMRLSGDEIKPMGKEDVKPSQLNISEGEETSKESPIIQLHNKFILTHIKTGFMIIDQHRAHQRILFDRFRSKKSDVTNCQQLLFPISLDLNPADLELINGMKKELEKLGFSIERIGKDSISINGIPTGCREENATSVLESMVGSYRDNKDWEAEKLSENLAMSLARSMSIKAGVHLSEKEMEDIVDRLFASDMPYSLPGGKPIVITIALEELDKRFKY